MRAFLLLVLLSAILEGSAAHFDKHRRHHHKHRSIVPRACKQTYTSDQMIKGPGKFPVVTKFVTQKGSQFLLNGKTFRPSGFNAYWLALDENVTPGTPSYPTKQRIREVMAQANAMGANTIRAHTLGISTGQTPLALYSGNGKFNEKAFETIDYAVYAAKMYGVYLVVPFTDNYDFYHGGKLSFLRFNGVDTGDAGQFYTSRKVIDDYKNYIKHWMSHKNQFTGIKNSEEPALAFFETGNELGAWAVREGPPPLEWTQEIAKHIKSLSKHSFVVDGTDGITEWENGNKPIPGLEAKSIKLASTHYYPLSSQSHFEEESGLATKAKKFTIVGEWDWTPSDGSVDSFMKSIESNKASGDFLWSMMTHSDDGCDYIMHGDGYSMGYPNADPDKMDQILSIVQHLHRMSGLSAPSRLPGVVIPQPELPKFHKKKPKAKVHAAAAQTNGTAPATPAVASAVLT